MVFVLKLRAVEKAFSCQSGFWGLVLNFTINRLLAEGKCPTNFCEAPFLPLENEGLRLAQ